MPRTSLGKAHQHLLNVVQDRFQKDRSFLLVNAWRRFAMGKFWSHRLVAEAQAAFTTGTLGWLAKATPIHVFQQQPPKRSSGAFFDGSALLVQADWLDQQAARLANDPQALRSLLEEGLRANARRALGFPIKQAGPWQAVDEFWSWEFIHSIPKLENASGGAEDLIQALQLADRFQPPAHRQGWEEELLEARTKVLSGRPHSGEWAVWASALLEWFQWNQQPEQKGQEYDWQAELLHLRETVGDRAVSLDDPDVVAELLEAMVCVRSGAAVEADRKARQSQEDLPYLRSSKKMENRGELHPCLVQHAPKTWLSDTSFQNLPSQKGVLESTFLEASRRTVANEQECFLRPILVDPSTGVPSIQDHMCLKNHLMAQAALAAISLGHRLTDPHAVEGSFPWIHRFTYLFHADAWTYNHPFVDDVALAKAWLERRAPLSEPKLPAPPHHPSKPQAWLLNHWVAHKKKPAALWLLLKQEVTHEPIPPEVWWAQLSPWKGLPFSALERFVKEHPGWLTEPRDAQKHCSEFFNAFRFFDGEAGKTERLSRLQRLGTCPTVWWAAAEEILQDTKTICPQLKRLLIRAIHDLDANLPSMGFQPSLREFIASQVALYRAKGLNRHLVQGTPQSKTPRL